MPTGLIVPDTSAWIEFLRGSGSRADHLITDLLGEPDRLVVTGPVLLEVLSGMNRPAERERVRDALGSCAYEAVQDPVDYEDAAAIYRECRAFGTTVRGHTDCLIAAVAMRLDAAVLASDADFEVIARHAPLELA
jgi:predicted nucleic acid-binding protein